MDQIAERPEIDCGDLLKRIRTGERAAEETLVQRFWRGVYFILFRQTGDQELSRDLAQDTFVLVIAKAREGAIEHPRALSSFIRQVGLNKLIGYRRKQARQNTEPDSDAIMNVADSSESLAANVGLEQVSVYVRSVLSELKHERDRDILRRHYLLGEDKNAICHALDLSKSQADVVLHRARERLKSLILAKGKDGKGPGAGDLLASFLIIGTLAKEFLNLSHYLVIGMLRGIVICTITASRTWLTHG